MRRFPDAPAAAMTTREAFAMAAMPACMELAWHGNGIESQQITHVMKTAAFWSVLAADALLAELAK